MPADVREASVSTLERLLTTYTLFVHDGRYAVPTLLTIESRDDERARAYAQRHLESSTHYRSVEIWEDERQVGELTLDRA